MNKAGKTTVFSVCMKRYGLRLGASVLVLTALTLVAVGAAEYIRKLADTVGGGGRLNAAEIICMAAAILTAGGVLYYLSGILTGTYGLRSVRDLRNALFEKILITEFRCLEENRSGGLLSRLTGDLRLTQEFLQDQLPHIIRSVIGTFCILSYMLYLNWRLLLLTMICFPAASLVMHFVANLQVDITKQMRRANDELTEAAQDAIGGVAVEKSYNLQSYVYEKACEKINALLKLDQREQLIVAFSGPFGSVIRWAPVFICCILGAYFTFGRQEMNGGDLLAFILMLGSVSGTLSELPYMAVSFRQSLVSIRRLDGILGEAAEPDGGLTQGENPREALRFDHVTFGYSEETQVLRGINFTVAAGHTAALVGMSGGGKSTVIKLLCGLYRPDSGRVCLFGSDLSLWDPAAARSRVSLVSQDIFLFPDSIAQNIALGKPGASQQEIESAARAANIHEFIISLPQGYDTPVGERGVQLSGGERQRISIARALLKNAPILFLDEPTASLDTHTEALILQALETAAAGKTVLTVAHRLSTVENADEILVMEHGRIVQRGTHRALIAENGPYRILYGAEEAEA